MTAPQTLARPLARRVADLELPAERFGSEPDIPDSVIQAAVDALARGETHYSDRPGIPEFRAWVASHLLDRYGVKLDPKEVTITCGSTEARYATMTLFAEAGSQVLCPGDAAMIAGVARLLGVEVVRTVDDPQRVKVLYLTPDDPDEVVDATLQLAAQHGWWMIWDMSFARRQRDFHPAQQPQLAAHVVTIDTVSEHMAGWRVGWMAGSEAALRLRAFKQSITICTTNVSQWAALEFVRSQ